MRLTICFLIILITFFSCKNHNDRKKNIAEKKDITEKKNQIRKCWINKKYLDSLKKEYPKYIKFCDVDVLIVLDSLKYVQIKGYLDRLETHDLIEQENKCFFYTSDSTKYQIKQINKDTLLLNDEVFVSNEEWEYWGRRFESKIKGDIFKEKYKNILNKKLNLSDSALIEYNPYYQATFLFNGYGCHNIYVIGVLGDTVSIYTYINSCDNTLYEKIEKKLLISFHK